MALVTLPDNGTPPANTSVRAELGNAVAVTPSDVNTFPTPVRIYVGGAGIVTAMPARQRGAAGQASVAITMVAGGWLPFLVDQVFATGTTATLMVACY